MRKPKIYPLPDDASPISSVNEIDYTASYNYADYMRFAFEERMEIIKGQVFSMSPAPARLHQKIITNIFGPLYNVLKDKKCEVYTAPFDVRLAKKNQEDKQVFTVVQPDIVVICDVSKLDERGCIGAPDIAVEILSPGNNRKELVVKYQVYEEAGVKEYWIVDPGNKTFVCYSLNIKGKFEDSGHSTAGQNIYSSVLPGFSLNLAEVFRN